MWDETKIRKLQEFGSYSRMHSLDPNFVVAIQNQELLTDIKDLLVENNLLLKQLLNVKETPNVREVADKSQESASRRVITGTSK